MLENLKLGLVILLTGIVVVFSVLVLLILIIKLYSTVVSNAQNSIEQRKIEKAKAEEKSVHVSAAEIEPEPETAAVEEINDAAIPGEIIAAIAAAVDTIFGEGNAVIKSVKRARQTKRRNAWRSAGVAENTRAF